MFKMFSKDKDMLIVYKSVMVDAATCILKKDNPEITIKAETAISNTFIEMDHCFDEKKQLSQGSGKKVRLQFLKNKDSDFIELTSMNSFKLWLIKMQHSEAFKIIMTRLKEYCRKKGDPLPEINIVFGDYKQESIYNTEVYFRNSYRTEWLRPEIIKKAIKDVDKSEVIDRMNNLNEAGHINKTAITINSPVFGIMPPEKLSGGVKTLTLIYNNPEMIFNASTCGDNCVKWIERFARELDFVICLYHTMHFTEKKFRAYIVNADTVVESYDDYIKYSDKYCRVLE